ncbi:hypothetical protein AAG906_033842 [Vitis piasezkii]
MEQFRQIGEVWGSLKALMVFKDDIQINRRQCCLLFDIFSSAFKTIVEEIRQNLRLEEKNTKWKALEQPLRELHRAFKDAELYIRNCLDTKDWWGKAMSLHQNNDSVEFHIHNLLCTFPIVIEAIETAGEMSGLALATKYEKEWNDPKLFQWKFGKQYLVTREICSRLESALREDRWLLLEMIREKKSSGSVGKNEQKLGDLLLKKLNGSEQFNGKLFPGSVLVGAKDYQVKRRLEGGSQCKEIQWLGEGFVLRQFFGEIEPLNSEISSLLSLSHPNIMQYLCGFYDEEKKECLLVMEMMNKDLHSQIKENCGQRRRILFPLPVMVDLMLQIARGMEYLHSMKVYHGDLNPSNIFLKGRNSSTEGYFHAKVSGFGLSSIKNHTFSRSSPGQNGTDPLIWHAPEVLAEQEQLGSSCSSKFSEKADVYSFGMLCFELLTGKVPFEDSHLQGDKMSRNIRAGERPLFPFPSHKYLANLAKRCWHTDPVQRPSFSSICRILRYIKRFLVQNPDHSQPDLTQPPVDYFELEAGFVKKLTVEGNLDPMPVSQIPFQMFAYRLVEKEKTSLDYKDKSSESASEAAASVSGDENVALVDDPFLQASEGRLVCSETPEKKISPAKISAESKTRRSLGTPKAQAQKPTPLKPCGGMKLNRGAQMGLGRTSGHALDSDVS